MKTIKLTQNKFALVDDEDFEWLNQWKWYYSNGYAMRKPHIRGSKPYRSDIIQMHRLVNKTPIKFQTDHINRNPLDNRKCNLRTVTLQKNHFNMKPKQNNISGMLGVNWSKKINKWRTRIMINGKDISLGYYINLEDAINVRRRAEQIYHII